MVTSTWVASLTAAEGRPAVVPIEIITVVTPKLNTNNSIYSTMLRTALSEDLNAHERFRTKFVAVATTTAVIFAAGTDQPST